MTIGPPITIATSFRSTWLTDCAAYLAHRLDHQLEAVHVAFGQIAAAGIERQPPGGRDKIVEREKVVGLLGFEETVLGQRHHHAAGKVLIALDHVDIGRSDPGHTV